MPGEDLRERVVGQFSRREDRADVWRALELVLDADRYLNLGYSPRGWPTLLGDSQRRLVDLVGDRLDARLPATEGVRLLDVGCGRGGPARRLAERHGFDVTGVDLVEDNVALAWGHARASGASFVVGDAAQLPVRGGAAAAATAVDALVYLPERRAVFEELARVLEPGGVLVVTDLLACPDPTAAERAALDAFADSWDMPPLSTVPAYQRAVEAAGPDVLDVADLTPHSVGRFRRYTAPYAWLADGPTAGALRGLLARAGFDPDVVDRQVLAAHRALPSLRHVLVVGEQREGDQAAIP